MAEFGFASDPFADFDGRETKDHCNGRSSRGQRSTSREKELAARPSRVSSGRDRSSDRDRHGRDRSSDRDRHGRDRSSDRDRHGRERSSDRDRERDRDRDGRDRERRRRSSRDRERSSDRDRERSSDRDRDRARHHQHTSKSSSISSRDISGPGGNAAFEPPFGAAFGASAPSGRSTGAAAALTSPPAEGRIRRMRRASVSAGTSAPLATAGDATIEAVAPAVGRVRRPRRTLLVGDVSTTAKSAAVLGSPTTRRLPAASRSSDGLEDMRHNLRSGLPEGLNVAASQPLRPQRRAGRRASLVTGSGGVSARNVRGEFTDEEVATTVSPEIRGFLEERTDRQRKLLDKFRHLNLDDDASVANPVVLPRRRDGGAGPAMASAVRTDLMLQQAAAQDRRSWRRSSLMGALSGVVGGAATPDPIRDEPERKNGGRSSGRDRRFLRSKSDSGEVISYDPARDRTRGGALLDRVGAVGTRSPMDRVSSGGANGKSYSDRIMQGR